MTCFVPEFLYHSFFVYLVIVHFIPSRWYILLLTEILFIYEWLLNIVCGFVKRQFVAGRCIFVLHVMMATLWCNKRKKMRHLTIFIFETEKRDTWLKFIILLEKMNKTTIFFIEYILWDGFSILSLVDWRYISRMCLSLKRTWYFLFC